MPRHVIAVLALSTAALLAQPVLAQPVMAQDGAGPVGSELADSELAGSEPAGAGERVNQLIVYGDDPCPAPATPDEITVCARKDEGERYRIPESLRGLDSSAAQPWSQRVRAYEMVTARGTLSCSPVGAGGGLGCTQQLIDAAYAEKRGGTDVKFSQLIADERARRLATIDADAAETQARVEAIERQYEARQTAAGQPAEPEPAPATAPQ